MTLTPQFQTEERSSLPPEAEAKLVQLREIAEDAAALVSVEQQRHRDAMFAANNANLDNVARSEALAEAERIQQKQAGRVVRRDSAVQISVRVNNFVNENNGKLAAYAGQIPVGPATLDEVRTRIKELRDASKEIHKASPAAADVKGRARAWLGDLARATIDEKGFPRFENKLANDHTRDLGDVKSLRMAYLLAPEATLAVIDRMIEEAFPKDGPTETDRRIASRDIADELLLLERREETIVERMLGDGQDVTRRPTANPLAVLGLAFGN